MIVRSKLLLVLSIVLLVAVFLVADINAQSDETAGGVVEEKATAGTAAHNSPLGERTALSPQEQAALLEAEPAELMVVSESELAQLQQDEQLSAMEAVPESTTATFPEADSQELARSLHPEAWEALDEIDEAELAEAEAMAQQLEEGMEPAGLDAVQNVNAFSRYLANGPNSGATNYLQTMYPHAAIGRLFFKKPGRTGWSSCTASVIGERTIVTAGHCVYTRSSNPSLRGWNRLYRFYPALRIRHNGSWIAPYGYFTSYRQRTMNNWIYNGAYSDDVAVLKLYNKGGRTIRQWVGKLGVGWNWGTNRHVHAFGYPGNLWGGRYLIATADQMWYNGSHTVGIGSDMQHGASGGPWVKRFQPLYTWSGTNIVESVNSFITGSAPNYNRGIYGPYFDSNNIKVLCNIEGC